jgi:hypothetical protein
MVGQCEKYDRYQPLYSDGAGGWQGGDRAQASDSDSAVV